MRRWGARAALVVAAGASVGTDEAPPGYRLEAEGAVEVALEAGDVARWRLRILTSPFAIHEDSQQVDLTVGVYGNVLSDGPAEVVASIRGPQASDEAVYGDDEEASWLRVELGLSERDVCAPSHLCLVEAELEVQHLGGEGAVSREMTVFPQLHVMGTNEVPESAALYLVIEAI